MNSFTELYFGGCGDGGVDNGSGGGAPGTCFIVVVGGGGHRISLSVWFTVHSLVKVVHVELE